MTAFFVATFPCWLRALDFYLLEQTGRVFGDLPIPIWTAWEWYAKGWAARDVAERLVHRAARLPRVTMVKAYGDDPRKRIKQ